MHFSISGAPWDAILAPRDLLGGAWEQQDRFEVVDKIILVDFGKILGLVYVSFWGPKWQTTFLFRFVSKSPLYRLLTRNINVRDFQIKVFA